MPTQNRRFSVIGQLIAVTLAVLCFASPAQAQFGALKKKLKGTTVEKAAGKAVDAAAGDEPAANAASPTGGQGGGAVVVLTPETVDRLIAAHKAGVDEKQRAELEDNSYGRYQRELAAYEKAKAKCGAAQLTWGQRAAADQKLIDKYSALTEKMVEAQGRGDYATMQKYQDQALSLMDPSCAVKQPQQPSDYYDAQRAIDTRAEQAALKASGFTASEYGQANDRALAILSGSAPAGDASPAENEAVEAKSAELKAALGIRDAQEARVAKPVPAPAPAPVAAPAPSAAPAVPAGASAMGACMANNAQQHQAEIEALGKRGEAAQKAGDTGAMMAIADTIMRIQMAGCAGAR